jgi:micrococcal nuclease
MGTFARRSAATVLAVLASAALGAAPPARLLSGTVVKVVDGDTVDVVLSQGRRRVRLIGVDAPELHDGPKLDREAAHSGRSRAAIRALGRAATAFTQRRLAGKAVGLELDVARQDRYGRLLAYLWLADGTLFNAELVREGYAQLLTVPPNVRHANELRRLEREARAAGRGLWAESPGDRGGARAW